MDVKGVGYSEIFLFLVLVYGLYKYWNRDPRLAHLPPHVRGWPIINQTLDQVKDNPIPMIQKWAKDYGELMRTTSGTTTFIWINSKRAFKELIDRRSAIYSSRHPQPMVQRASGGKRMVFMPYGKDWRAIRNIIHRVSSFTVSINHLVVNTCHVEIVFTNSDL
jgi:Cytochrome P450